MCLIHCMFIFLSTYVPVPPCSYACQSLCLSLPLVLQCLSLYLLLFPRLKCLSLYLSAFCSGTMTVTPSICFSLCSWPVILNSCLILCLCACHSLCLPLLLPMCLALSMLFSASAYVHVTLPDGLSICPVTLYVAPSSALCLSHFMFGSLPLLICLLISMFESPSVHLSVTLPTACWPSPLSALHACHSLCLPLPVVIYTVRKIPFISSFPGNCATSVSISTLMCL